MKFHGGRSSELVTMEVPASSPGAGVNGIGVDMQELGGWDGVIFEAVVGVIGNGGTFDMRAVQSANANFSGAVNIADADNSSNTAAAVQVANTVANVVVSIDVFRPVNRYLRAVVTAATNNANVAVTARRYRNQGRTPVALPNNFQYVSIRAS